MSIRIRSQLTPRKMIVGLLLAMLLGSTVIVSTHDERSRVTGGYVITESSEAAPMLGLLVDQNLKILSVDATLPGGRAGLQPGDLLTSIGGVSLPPSVSISPLDAVPSALDQVPALIASSADIKQLFHHFVPEWERTISITVNRGGQRLTLPVLVTAKAYNYDPNNPPPPSTPVPAALTGTTFFF